MTNPQSFISLDLVTFVLLSCWCFAVCLLLLTRRALFPVLWYLHLRAHPQLPWSAFWWSLLPVDCSTPTESKKKQLRREWQQSNCILDHRVRTWLWALSSWFSLWHCLRACLSASSAWARWAFSKHFWEYCSDNTSISRWKEHSSSLKQNNSTLRYYMWQCGVQFSD